MQFYFDQVIPAGLVIEVKSWENDGDHYAVNQLDGLTHSQVKTWLKILQLYTGRQMGNDDFSLDAFLEYVYDFQSELDLDYIKSYFGFSIPSTEDAFEAWLAEDKDYDHEHILGCIQKLTGEPVEYDYDFIRVVDGIRIYEIKEEIIIPAAPKIDPIKSIELGYWAEDKANWDF